MILFRDRDDAGRSLTKALAHLSGQDGLVLGIPRGGVAVAYHVAAGLALPLDVIVVRKIPVPWNSEAGFGAVGPDGTVTLHEGVARHLSLSPETIDRLAAEVLEEVRRRMKVYREDRPQPDLHGKTALIVDDGLATGVTTLAAVRSARAQGAARVVVASPVASGSGLRLVRPDADEIVTLYVHPEHLSFAVAAFYREWSDMTDREVLDYLRRPIRPSPSTSSESSD